LRIEDCICDLGVDVCVEAIESGASPLTGKWASVVATWEHARTVARYAKLIAEHTTIGINPDQAYLGGLLHILGTLPGLFEWAGHDRAGHPGLVAMNLAEAWQLPGYIKDLFCECLGPGGEPRWSRILEDAHRLAGTSGRCCWLGHALRLAPASEA
jgi:hypothetical protein